MTLRGRWVEAGDLQPGDAILQADGETGEVLSVQVVAAPQWMYNLSVDVAHIFFVGQQQWLVHNCGGKQGGRYKYLDAQNGTFDRNHMPADSVSLLSHGNGPAILMEKADHMLTSSWGSSRVAKAWRATQKKLIDAGLFDDAIQMDIDDIQRLFGDKYDKAILELIDSLQ